MREEVESQGGRRGNIQYGTVGLKKEQRTMQLMKNVRQTESSRTGRESRHTQLIWLYLPHTTHTHLEEKADRKTAHTFIDFHRQTDIFSLTHIQAAACFWGSFGQRACCRCVCVCLRTTRMLSSSTTVPPTTMKSQRKRRQHVSVEMCVHVWVLGLHLYQIKALGCIDRINCQKHEIEFLFLDSCMDE